MNKLPFDIVGLISEFDPALAYACYPKIKSRPTKALVQYCINHNKFDMFDDIFDRVDYTTHESNTLLTKVVKLQRINFAARVFERFPNTAVLTRCINYVSYDGNLEFIRWMVKNGAQFTSEVVAIVVSSGHANLLEYYLSFWFIDPSIEDNEAFWIAFDRRSEVITWMLYEHYRVNVEMSPDHLRQVFEAM